MPRIRPNDGSDCSNNAFTVVGMAERPWTRPADAIVTYSAADLPDIKDSLHVTTKPTSSADKSVAGRVVIGPIPKSAVIEFMFVVKGTAATLKNAKVRISGCTEISRDNIREWMVHPLAELTVSKSSSATAVPAASGDGSTIFSETLCSWADTISVDKDYCPAPGVQLYSCDLGTGTLAKGAVIASLPKLGFPIFVLDIVMDSDDTDRATGMTFVWRIG